MREVRCDICVRQFSAHQGLHNRESRALPSADNQRPDCCPRDVKELYKENPAEARKIMAQYTKLPKRRCRRRCFQLSASQVSRMIQV
jgi:hypothetical protein